MVINETGKFLNSPPEIISDFLFDSIPNKNDAVILIYCDVLNSNKIYKEIECNLHFFICKRGGYLSINQKISFSKEILDLIIKKFNLISLDNHGFFSIKKIDYRLFDILENIKKRIKSSQFLTMLYFINHE